MRIWVGETRLEFEWLRCVAPGERRTKLTILIWSGARL
jgi:hypothetical protein